MDSIGLGADRVAGGDVARLAEPGDVAVARADGGALEAAVAAIVVVGPDVDALVVAHQTRRALGAARPPEAAAAAEAFVPARAAVVAVGLEVDARHVRVRAVRLVRRAAARTALADARVAERAAAAAVVGVGLQVHAEPVAVGAGGAARRGRGAAGRGAGRGAHRRGGAGGSAWFGGLDDNASW